MKYIQKCERLSNTYRYVVYDDIKQTQMEFYLTESDAYWVSVENDMIRVDDTFIYQKGFDNFEHVNPDGNLIPLPF